MDAVARQGARGLMDVQGRAGDRNRRRLSPGEQNGSEKRLYEFAPAPGNRCIAGKSLKRSGLNSSDVLATLFDLEMKGIIRQTPGKQFSRILL